MFDSSTVQWGLLTILGPILLGAAILWAIFRNRGTRRDVERTEEATRRMYDEQNRRDTVGENR